MEHSASVWHVSKRPLTCFKPAGFLFFSNVRPGSRFSTRMWVRDEQMWRLMPPVLWQLDSSQIICCLFGSQLHISRELAFSDLSTYFPNCLWWKFLLSWVISLFGIFPSSSLAAVTQLQHQIRLGTCAPENSVFHVFIPASSENNCTLYSLLPHLKQNPLVALNGNCSFLFQCWGLSVRGNLCTELEKNRWLSFFKEFNIFTQIWWQWVLNNHLEAFSYAFNFPKK